MHLVFTFVSFSWLYKKMFVQIWLMDLIGIMYQMYLQHNTLSKISPMSQNNGFIIKSIFKCDIIYFLFSLKNTQR